MVYNILKLKIKRKELKKMAKETKVMTKKENATAQATLQCLINKARATKLVIGKYSAK